MRKFGVGCCEDARRRGLIGLGRGGVVPRRRYYELGGFQESPSQGAVPMSVGVRLAGGPDVAGGLVPLLDATIYGPAFSAKGKNASASAAL